MTSDRDEISPPLPAVRYATPVDDGWAWVLKAASLLALAMGICALAQVMTMLLYGWFTGGGRGLSLRLSEPTGWMVVLYLGLMATGAAALIVAGWSGLVRSSRARRLMVIGAILHAIGPVVVAVVGYLQISGMFRGQDGAFLVWQAVRIALECIAQLWLPALLLAVATRPAVRRLLEVSHPGTAFETLPVAVPQPVQSLRE